MAVNRPTKIGKYDVIDIIGRGGMGIVYRARDPYLDRPVAIKMMTGSFSENPDLLKRFFREAQSTASLQHPNIVTVYELGDHSGNPYLVMEYLDGESLDSVLLSPQQPTLGEKLELVLEVCYGLSYAHQRGVVHRDIKPGNIMVTKNGGLKIVDFGIAHFGDNNNVTRTGQIVGSINYMSPEQVNGRSVDARTDIFSTAVVLYQLLTRSLPFEGDSAAATLLKIIDEPAPPLGSFLANYPPQLDAILSRALAKDRNQRYSSADELALDLGQVHSELKQELIGRYIEDARRYIQNDDFYRAKEQLLHVLKTDRQNTQASLLLREVQEKIQGLEISKEIQQLRVQAEESLLQEHFENAVALIDRALVLDKNNSELRRLRDDAQASALRVQSLRRAISLAESAHQSGDLDSAKEAIEQALSLAPNDTHAKSLHRAIQRDWEERERQRRIEDYVEQARSEITSRKFTAALELLRKAEALDSAAPHLQALIASTRAAQEQERRRRELESINREIEEALNRDDYQTATLKADAALKAFPEERSLLKLRALAQKQREVAEKKQLVEEQLAEARSLLDQGRSEELVGRLEATLAKVGGDPRLQSLLLIVRENVRRERMEQRKAEYLQKAKDALRRKDHQEAERILEAAKAELPEAGEIDDLLQFTKEEAAAEERRRAADAAAEEAHRLLAEQEFEPAIRLLETTLEKLPDEELRIVLGEARRAALDFQKKMESALTAVSNLIRGRRAGEALKLLDAQPASFANRKAFQRLREAARRQAEILSQVEAAIERSRELLASEKYSEAAGVLERCKETHGGTPELEAEIAEVLRKQEESATVSVRKSLGDARILVNATQYRSAIDRLLAGCQLWPLVSASLRAECEATKQKAATGLAYQRKAEIERRLSDGELTDAADLLQRTLTELPGQKELSELETVIQQETERKLQAQAKLAEAQTLFQNAAWGQGAERLKEAFAAAERAPLVRDAVLKTFVEGAQAAADNDWQAAETLLLDAGALQATYPGITAISGRIAERKREQALQEERQARQREREEKEAFLQELGERLKNELQLEMRTTILADAAGKYPDDASLQRQLAQARGLAKRIAELANEARTQEEAKRYRSALRDWESIRQLSPEYLGLQDNVERTRKLYTDARAAALDNLHRHLSAGELEQARAALTEVGQELLEGDELAAIQIQIQDAQKLRSKAEKSLPAAEKALLKGHWQKAVELLKRACAEARQDPVVVGAAREHLLEAFDSAVESDWQSGNLLLLAATDLHSDPGVLASLKKRVDDKKRQEIIAGYLDEARQAQQRSDWRRASEHIQSGLQEYPDNQQLLQAKAEIERCLLEIEQERIRQKELATQREAELRRQTEEKRREREQQQARAKEARRAVRIRELETGVTGPASPKPAIAGGRDASPLARPGAGKRGQPRIAVIAAACVVLLLGVIVIRLSTTRSGAPAQPTTNTSPGPATAANPKTVAPANSPSVASRQATSVANSASASATGNVATISQTPTASTGTLSISVGKKAETGRLSDTLSAVNVLINGKKYGETSSDGSLQLPLQARLYVIGVQKNGFNDARPQQVRIRPGQTSRLHFELQPSRPESTHINSSDRPGPSATSTQTVLANLPNTQTQASEQPATRTNNQSPQTAAPAPATVASPAPATASRPRAGETVGLTENDMILATLRSLEQAYSVKDANAVCGIWPKCPRKTFEQVFKSAQSASLSLHPLEAASISGDSASIVCTRRTVTVYAGAQQNVNEQMVTIHLRKQNDSWRIDFIN